MHPVLSPQNSPQSLPVKFNIPAAQKLAKNSVIQSITKDNLRLLNATQLRGFFSPSAIKDITVKSYKNMIIRPYLGIKPHEPFPISNC